MSRLFIMDSIFDQPIVAGYSLKAIFEYWQYGLIIIIALLVMAAVALKAVWHWPIS